MPSGNYYSYTSSFLHRPSYQVWNIQNIFQALIDIWRYKNIFKYVVRVIKQSCEQYKHVYIFINVYYKHWN
jgi:hypothetical protein